MKVDLPPEGKNIDWGRLEAKHWRIYLYLTRRN